jgi:tetratricopeptide (TPR) repeat protein
MTDLAGPIPEDEYIAWLAAHDDAVAARRPTKLEQETASLPAALRVKLKEDGAWCEFVRAAWGDSGDDLPPEAAPSLRMDDSMSRFGRFEIRGELGRGSFGVVFRAFDPRLRRQVALKLPRPEVMVTAEMRARFAREARAAAMLDHPNLVPVFEAGEEGSICFIASAYCPGTTLSEWLKSREEPVPPRLAARIAATLAGAIAHAHARGVLHRDLKPGNIMLEPLPDDVPASPGRDGMNFVPRVTDFGLARLSAAGTEATAATQSGEILGTPSYMSPEQADGRVGAIGPATDVYGLGGILYALLTGRPPFQSHSPLDTLLLLRTEEPIAPSHLRPRLPRDLETVCLKCLDKRPQKRYASADALAVDLDRYLAGKPVVARRVGSAARVALWCRREPALASTIAVAILAVAAVASFGFWRVVHERDRYRTERDRAVANLRKAREAVDSMLTRVSTDRLRDVPQVELIRLELLEDARNFYRGFARQADGDPEILLEASQAYWRLGLSYDGVGRLDDASSSLREALAIQEKLAAGYPAVAVYRWALAQTYRSLGQLAQLSFGGSDEALQALKKAIVLLEELGSVDPSNPEYRRELAATHGTRGMLLVQRLGQVSAAEADFRKATELFDGLAASFPAIPKYQSDAAIARYNLACWMGDAGQLDEKEKLLRPIVEFWEKSAAAEPAAMNHRSKLAITLTDLADVLEKTNHMPEAERVLRRSAEVRLELSKDSPKYPWNFIQAGDLLARLAGLVALRGDLAAARQIEEQAIAQKRAALALAPANPDYLQRVSTSQVALIETFIRLHEYEDAARAVAELVSFSAESGPQCFVAGSLLARCVPSAAADARLTEARRSELAKRYGDRAVELLQKAKKRGHQDVLALKSDHSLDSIRSRADFQALLAGSVASDSKRSP